MANDSWVSRNDKRSAVDVVDVGHLLLSSLVECLY